MCMKQPYRQVKQSTSKDIFTTLSTRVPLSSKHQKSANVATQTTTNNIGLGGPNKNADLVNLYSKTANINAQVQAEYAITTVTGTNQISDVGQVTPITSNQTTTNTTKPTTAIDIKSLGGMTAGSISLVGTDKGFGVNQAGSLNAKQAITITADGKITLWPIKCTARGGQPKSNTAVGLNGSTSNKTTIWASKDIAMIAPTIMANHCLFEQCQQHHIAGQTRAWHKQHNNSCW